MSDKICKENIDFLKIEKLIFLYFHILNTGCSGNHDIIKKEIIPHLKVSKKYRIKFCRIHIFNDFPINKINTLLKLITLF